MIDLLQRGLIRRRGKRYYALDLDELEEAYGLEDTSTTLMTTQTSTRNYVRPRTTGSGRAVGLWPSGLPHHHPPDPPGSSVCILAS
jgi:hypothetical protein